MAQEVSAPPAALDEAARDPASVLGKRAAEEPATAKRARTEAAAPEEAPISTVAELVAEIEAELARGGDEPLWKKAPMRRILERFEGGMEELQRYALFDESKNYTRNLISTDNEQYTLMLLCWNPSKYSPIHDHPCDGCWLRGMQGAVNEVRYREEDGKLVETDNATVTEGAVAYMDDSLGFHKVGNPTDQPACTMHLYSPPYERCRIWLQTDDASKCLRPIATYYSENGEKIDYSA